MSGTWPMVPLGRVLQLQRRWLKAEPTKAYIEIGIRSFGKGIFQKPPVSGLSLGDKRVLRIEPGDLVFMNVFAWEGAVGVAGPNEAGTIGSHRFATFTPVDATVDVNFLRLYFATPDGRDLLGRVSPGSAGRNRTMNLAAFAQRSVPLPPVGEQRRIVARIDALAAKIAEASALRNGARYLSGAVVASWHIAATTDVPAAPLSRVLELHEVRSPIQPGETYPQVGVRGFGGGLFARETLTAGETTYREFNRLYAGGIVLSQVKGWEGAVAACPNYLAGRFVSPEFRTFRCRQGYADVEYLSALVATEWFWSKLATLTRGVGARRERIRPDDFLALEVRMPPLPVQLIGVHLWRSLGQLTSLHSAQDRELSALLPSVLSRAFRGEL